MQEAPTTEALTPRDDEDEDEENENDNDNEDEEIDDDEEQAEPDNAPTPSRSERVSRSTTPRKRARASARRRGRGSRLQSLKVEASDGNNEDSDAPTPRRRGGLRGSGRGRWAGHKKGAPVRNVQMPTDEEGNILEVVDDEVELPEDEEGERKIDKNGVLQDGRAYRVRTFTIIGRGKRLYMLSTEPARCIGFRDSYLFFQKHKHLYKIILDEDEKRDLIDRDLLPHSYKGRTIGVVTARSVFREFGAKIVIGGRQIKDDYKVAELRQQAGYEEGVLAVPEDKVPMPGESYNRNQYVAWHGASSVYHTNVPTVPLKDGKVVEGKKRRAAVTGENWMLEHARDASRFNSVLASARSGNSHGVYDIHTNTTQWPGNLQPTHARWQQIHGERSLDEADTIVRTRLSWVPPVYSRNYRIHDLCVESAPDSSLSEPGLGALTSNLTSVPAHVLDALPLECQQAYRQAIEREFQWRSKWLNERANGHRADLLCSVEWYPK